MGANTQFNRLSREIGELREQLKSADGESSAPIIKKILAIKGELKNLAPEEQLVSDAFPIDTSAIVESAQTDPVPEQVTVHAPEIDPPEVEMPPVPIAPEAPLIESPDQLPEEFHARVRHIIEDRLDAHKLRRISDAEIREALSVAKDIAEAKQYLRLLLNEIIRAESELKTLREGLDEDDEPPLPLTTD